MAEESAHTATTEAPKSEGGFPPFDTTTFPSQLFWLAISFAFLFTVLWRVAGPRINGAITNRRGMINGAIAEAGKARAEAEAAQAAYENALGAARARAHAQALADAKAHDAMAAADARIAQTRDSAKAAVTLAARDAAIAIVERLTGDKVSADDAAKALGN